MIPRNPPSIVVWMETMANGSVACRASKNIANSKSNGSNSNHHNNQRNKTRRRHERRRWCILNTTPSSMTRFRRCSSLFPYLSRLLYKQKLWETVFKIVVQKKRAALHTSLLFGRLGTDTINTARSRNDLLVLGRAATKHNQF